MSNYDINAIESLSFKDGVRKRIQMYLGSATTEGIWQGLKEIINNSTDEALAGYGKEIIIGVNESNQEFSVRDFGRSVPWGFRENGENVLVSIFTKAHTGGKFDHKSYAQSVGTNGIGSSATCLSSYYFQVESYRDGKSAIARFEKGENVSYVEKDTKEKTGTYIIYRPDEEVFTDAESPLTYERICNEVKNISYLNSGIKFSVKNLEDNTEKIYYSKNGISDFICDTVNKPLMSKPLLASKTNEDSTDTVEVALMWTEEKEQFYCFVNGGFCNEGGAPITGLKTSLTNTMKKLVGKDVDTDLFRKGLCYVVNCKVANPSFEGQTKSKINNTSLRTLAGQATKEALENFSHTSEFKNISDMIIKFQKAEKAADRAREAVLNQNKEIEKELKKKIILQDKLVDCRRHDETSQLMICEGHSARGALVKARSGETTACFELKGKPINVLKNSIEKVAENEEVKALHIALGCGLGDKFNIKKLRYGKVVIMADMDKDGYDIVCLLLAFFYKMYPQLLKMGKIYWGVTPLFKVETKKETYFAYNEDELKTLPKGEVTRLKGLGESQPADFRKTIFSDNPRMVKMTMEDGEQAAKYFDILLGTNIEARKEYVFSHVDFENLED